MINCCELAILMQSHFYATFEKNCTDSKAMCHKLKDDLFEKFHEQNKVHVIMFYEEKIFSFPDSKLTGNHLSVKTVSNYCPYQY